MRTWRKSYAQSMTLNLECQVGSPEVPLGRIPITRRSHAEPQKLPVVETLLRPRGISMRVDHRAQAMEICLAKFAGSRSHQVPGRLWVTELFFEVPLDYSRPQGKTIRIFARSARRYTPPQDSDPTQQLPPPQGSIQNTSVLGSSRGPQDSYKDDLPLLLYLQGGPGMECRPPQSCGFTNFFLDKGYQMIFLDQRGTGLSTPVTAGTLAAQGDDAAQAQYLTHFRADNIVRDAEAVRLALTQHLPLDIPSDSFKRKWSTLGQSFGGFCTVTYLSMYPQGLRECFITGGLPPLVSQPDDVYTRLFAKCKERNEAYYTKYPEDVKRVKHIIRELNAAADNTRPAITFASGATLTARHFLQLGIRFGMHGGLDAVHDIVLAAYSELTSVGFLTPKTLATISAELPFDENPLYAVLHEPLYCDGPGQASNWSARRVLKHTYPAFDTEKTLNSPEQPTLFTGEMVFPFMFASDAKAGGTYAQLPQLRNIANHLASHKSWPRLYDREQLGRNTVPVYAAVYLDDMYVDFEYSMQTARAVRGCRTFVTNRLYHNALGSRMENVLEELWKLRGDCID